jgi:hypothetical protein
MWASMKMSTKCLASWLNFISSESPRLREFFTPARHRYLHLYLVYIRSWIPKCGTYIGSFFRVSILAFRLQSSTTTWRLVDDNAAVGTCDHQRLGEECDLQAHLDITPASSLRHPSRPLLMLVQSALECCICYDSWMPKRVAQKRSANHSIGETAHEMHDDNKNLTLKVVLSKWGRLSGVPAH